MARYFAFRQNNSGGSFDIADDRGIGPRVWIEAPNLADAVQRALAIGIYFNGCEAGLDCDCCGDRWHEPCDEGEAAPDISPEYDFNWHPTVYVHQIDGSITRIAQASA